MEVDNDAGAAIPSPLPPLYSHYPTIHTSTSPCIFSISSHYTSPNMAESNTQPTEPRLEEESDVNMADETRLSTQEVPTPTITITNPTTDVEEPTISSLTSAPPILAEMIISPSSAPTDSSSPSNNPEQAIASSSTDTSTGVRVFNPSETTSPISTPCELFSKLWLRSDEWKPEGTSKLMNL